MTCAKCGKHATSLAGGAEVKKLYGGGVCTACVLGGALAAAS